MDQKESRVALEPHLGNEIHLVPLTGRYVSKYLLIEELEYTPVDVGADLRQEQRDKLQKKRRNQLLEQPVVIDHYRRVYIIRRHSNAR
jgi:hypothetical protein